MPPFTSYLRFLLGSTNEHGVHSPFLFKYLTQCLYAGPKKHPETSRDIIVKSIPYFNFKNVLLPESEGLFKGLLAEEFPGLKFSNPPYDLIYLSGPDPNFLTNSKDRAALFHNDSLCVIDKIHKNRRHTALWEEIKSLKEIQVSIDSFHCGLVFFRREQVRQHFKIRI